MDHAFIDIFPPQLMAFEQMWRDHFMHNQCRNSIKIYFFNLLI